MIGNEYFKAQCFDREIRFFQHAVNVFAYSYDAWYRLTPAAYRLVEISQMMTSNWDEDIKQKDISKFIAIGRNFIFHTDFQRFSVQNDNQSQTFKGGGVNPATLSEPEFFVLTILNVSFLF